MTDNMRGAVLMLGSMAFFTFNDTFMKSLSDELPLFQAIFMRGVASCIFITILAVVMGQFRFAFQRGDWVFVTLRTLAEVGAADFFITALFNAPIANITAILQALPLTVTLAGAVFLGEPIGWRRMTAILVGFVGVLLIVKPGFEGFDIYSLYALATVAVVTLRDLVVRRMSDAVPSLAVAALGAYAVMIFAGLMSLSEAWVVPSALAVGQLGGAVIFIIGAYAFSVMTMRQGDIGMIAPLRYTGLLWALLLGWLVFDEWPDVLTLLGSAIVVATGLFTLLRENSLGRKKVQPAVRIR